MKPFMLSVLLVTAFSNLMASGGVPIIEQVGDTFAPNDSRRIVHSTAIGDTVRLITHESEQDLGHFGYFTFNENRELYEARIFHLKGRSDFPDVVLYLCAFGRGKNTVLGGVTSTFLPLSSSLWLSRCEDSNPKQPELILRNSGEAEYLDRWWILNVGKSRKLLLLKAKRIENDQPNTPSEWQAGWLHCYNLEQMDNPKSEGVVCILDAESASYRVECAAEGNEIYIWQTIYKKPDFGKQTLRVSSWSTDGALDWLVYKTKPQVYFTVDYDHGSTALVFEMGKRKHSVPGFTDSHIYLAKAGMPKMSHIGSLPAVDLAVGFQLIRTEQDTYPWAGLVAPLTIDTMFLFRADDRRAAVSKLIPKSFETLSVGLVDKGEQLQLISVMKNEITLNILEDFWTK